MLLQRPTQNPALAVLFDLFRLAFRFVPKLRLGQEGSEVHVDLIGSQSTLSRYLRLRLCGRPTEGFGRAVVVLALEAGEIVLPLCYGVGVALATVILALALAAE